MHEHLLRTLKANDVEYRINQEFERISSIRLGGFASVFVLPNSIEKLIFVLDYFHKSGEEYRLLGNMTNILPPDGAFSIPIVTTRNIRGVEESQGVISALCGESAYSIMRYAMERGLGGIEPLSGIPGTLGGLVAMNAGAFGREISDFLLDALVYDCDLGERITLCLEDFNFSYRDSVLKHRRLVLLSARLLLKRKSKVKIMDSYLDFKAKRLASQPTEPSLGSVFRRDGEIIPAVIIDTLGLKGYRIGGAEISKKHAGFIVNSGGATSEDYKALVKFIKSELYKRRSVRLKEEVEYL